ELVFVGFDSLQAATPEKCRPFDSNRSGMVLGEGAALFALEEFESARRHGAEILGEIIGYGISTDNHHLTQPNPDGSGPRRAMQQAVADAGTTPDCVGYINAHGTATIFNDSAEGKAIAEMFGNTVRVSSTKSMMEHSLGAAGVAGTRAGRRPGGHGARRGGSVREEAAASGAASRPRELASRRDGGAGAAERFAGWSRSSRVRCAHFQWRRFLQPVLISGDP